MHHPFHVDLKSDKRWQVTLQTLERHHLLPIAPTLKPLALDLGCLYGDYARGMSDLGFETYGIDAPTANTGICRRSPPTKASRAAGFGNFPIT